MLVLLTIGRNGGRGIPTHAYVDSHTVVGCGLWLEVEVDDEVEG